MAEPVFKKRRKKDNRGKIDISSISSAVVCQMSHLKEQGETSVTPQKVFLPTVESSKNTLLSSGDDKVTVQTTKTSPTRKSKGRFGPIGSSSNIRITTRFDYQPDVCKDYKETGYCGYGDSCKFLHDRSDYKPGWVIEKEWEVSEKRKRATEKEAVVDERKLDTVCPICSEEFKRPVKTICGHDFCEDCALVQYAKDSKCAVCAEPTKGIFNVAREITVISSKPA